MTLIDLMEILCDAYPREKLPDKTLKLYIRTLADLPVDVLEEAIWEIVATLKYMPTIAVIRAVACERILALPTEEEALGQVDALMASRASGSPQDAPALHPLTREAVDLVGGFQAFREARNPGAQRQSFLGIYRRLRERRLTETQTAPALPRGKDWIAIPAPRPTGQ